MIDFVALEKKIKKSNGKAKVDALNDLGHALQISDPKKAQGYAQKSFKLADKLNYPKGKAKSYLVTAYAYSILGDLQLANENNQSALEIYSDLNNKVGIAISYWRLGTCLRDQFKFSEAIECYMKAIDLLDKEGRHESIAHIYNDMAFIFWKRNEIDRTMNYLKLALEVYQKLNQKIDESTVLSNIGTISLETGKLDDALSNLNRSLELLIEVEEPENRNTAHIHNNIGRVYFLKGDYNQALEHYHHTLRISEKIEHKEGMTWAYANLAEVLTKLEKFNEAEKLVKVSLKICKEIDNKSCEMDCTKSAAYLYFAQDKYREAYQYYKQYAEIKEMIFDEQKGKQIEEMQTRFETQQKTHEAEIYRLKNIELAKEIAVRKKVESELKKYKDDLEELVKDRTMELDSERKVLSEKNVVLNHLLQHMEQQREEDRRKTYLDIEKNILPLLEKAKKNRHTKNRKDMEAIELTLNAILTKDVDDFKKRYGKLTSRESEVCNFIKKGLSSKQISDKLNLSLVTIYTFRQRIRKKLDLQNKEVDLATFLRSHS